MRAATQATWLQVIAFCEQLKVREAFCQLIVAILRHISVRNSKCAFASHAAILEHRSYATHFLLSCKNGSSDAKVVWRRRPRGGK